MQSLDIVFLLTNVYVIDTMIDYFSISIDISGASAVSRIIQVSIIPGPGKWKSSIQRWKWLI